MEIQAAIVLIIVFFLLLAFSVPVSFSIISASLVTLIMFLTPHFGVFISAQKMVTGIDSFTLLAVPFFVLAGLLMSNGGIAKRLINLAMLVLGKVPGSLAMTNIAGNAMFGSISGSGIAAATAIGGVMQPLENEQGYDRAFSAAANVASAPVGQLIPPTASFIVFSAASGGVSVAALLMAGWIAEEMMTDSVQSIQIAPGGVVTDIYPQEGNDAGKINLLNDKDSGEICRYGRDNKVVTMQGPFQLKQGEYGIAVRKPVYIEENGHEDFWGFTIVIIRVPEIFADSMKALSDFGYNYTLYKTAFPWESEFEEVYGSEEELKNPVSYTFDIGDSKWKLDIMPYKTQSERIYLYAVGIGGIIIVLLLTGFTCALLVLDEHRKKFKKLAITDALTGINNRHGYDERVTRYLKQNPDNHCVGVEFDIDDFKTINDMYGHAYGDVALKVLSEGMQKFFDKNVLLGRNGGDEFCIFLPDCTCADVKEKLEEFTKLKRSFKYEGEEHQFTISVGYAEYPVHADKPSKLMRCADTALYEVKLRGKNGCMAYKNGLRKDIRTQLGFALKDVSENLPGAFIIYKADKNDDEILFANREFIRFAGCKNMDELLVYTKRSFRNIIRVDEREAVIADIWKQIDEGHTNGYTHFYMQKADGGHIQVFDHGRIVENGRYGRVIYALITNLETVRENYGNSECNN